MKQLYFIDLWHNDIQGKCANHHLMKAQFDTELGEWSYPDSENTHCKRYWMDQGATVSPFQLIRPDPYNNANGNLDTTQYNEEEYLNFVRQYLAESQNSGTDFCAHCVAQFYKIEAEEAL